jgi:hypothetical protein
MNLGLSRLLVQKRVLHSKLWKTRTFGAKPADGIVDDRTYKHAWNTVLDYFKKYFPDLAVTNDKACKDIARLCFVSDDPDIYINPDARLYAGVPGVMARKCTVRLYTPFFRNLHVQYFGHFLSEGT